MHRYDYILNALTTKVAKKRVVDCACGDGTGSKCLKEAGALVTAIDIDKDEIQRCLNTGIEDVRQGDIRKLDLPDCYCDLFFCSETLEHLVVSDCPKAVLEIQRITKSGGTICVTVPESKKSLRNPLHKTWVQHSDIEKWFGQCKIVFTGNFVKAIKDTFQLGCDFGKK